VITEEQRELVDRLLLERISLRGICRAVGVGLQWLLQFMVERFQAVPNDLYVKPADGTSAVILQRLEAELDELGSFVGKKANRYWVWIAMDASTRQVMAFHVGDRSQDSAEQLWANIPAVYREQAIFYTDQYTVYKGVIPPAQHALSPSSLVRPITSSASTVRCGNGSPGWYARHYRSQRILPTISVPSSISFVTTTSPKVRHYQNSTTIECI
jgi:IS1 family transposase